MPRVSVIIPTFNCAAFLTKAVESVFAQTYTDYEVIVTDDGSTDGTRGLIAQWEGKVRYFYQPNRGVSSARNLAACRASGEFLAYLDADDVCYPNRLEVQVAFLDAHPECGLVHSDVSILDENGRVIIRSFNRETERFPPKGYCLMDLLRRGHVSMPSVMERRICFELTGGFKECLSHSEDYLHYIQVVLHGYAIGYVDKPLAMCRRRSNSATSSDLNVAEGLCRMLRLLLKSDFSRQLLDAEAQQIIRGRIDDVERSLPYLYRREGRIDLARRKTMALIRKSPFEFDLYVELLKSWLFPVAHTLRRFRDL